MPLLTTVLRRDDHELRFFSTITTFATSRDVTLDELRPRLGEAGRDRVRALVVDRHCLIGPGTREVTQLSAVGFRLVPVGNQVRILACGSCVLEETAKTDDHGKGGNRVMKSKVVHDVFS